MRTPISIIVIAHHNHITLSSCLDSIEASSQSFDQLILVGDDINSKVLAEFQKRNKWLIVRSEKKSPAGARNVGAKKAIHNYLAFFDDDSFVPQGWFEEMLSKMNESPWFVLGQSEILYEKEDPRISSLKEEIKRNQKKFNPFKRQIQLGQFMFGLDTAAVLVKRSWHEAIRGFNENLRIGEDTDYTLRTLFLGGDYFLTTKTHIVEIYNPNENLRTLLRKYFEYGKTIPQVSTIYCKSILLNDYCKNTFFIKQSFPHFLVSLHVLIGLALAKKPWRAFPEIAPAASKNLKKSVINGCSPYLRTIYWRDEMIEVEMDQI